MAMHFRIAIFAVVSSAKNQVLSFSTTFDLT